MDILKIWQGGFVFYGGLAGGLFGAYVFLKFKKEPVAMWADFMAPILAFGYSLGRLGCFLNGCCYGRVCSLRWAIEFTQPGLPSGLRHPTQLYASSWEFFVLLILLAVGRWKKNRREGSLFILWLFLHASGRLAMEFFRDDYRGDNINGFSISSLVSITILLLIIAFKGTDLLLNREHR